MNLDCAGPVETQDVLNIILIQLMNTADCVCILHPKRVNRCYVLHENHPKRTHL